MSPESRLRVKVMFGLGVEGLLEALDGIVDFLGFAHTDRDGIDEVIAGDVAEGGVLIFRGGEFTFAEDFHADDELTVGAGDAEGVADFFDCAVAGVFATAFVVDAGEDDIDPGVGGGDFEGVVVMAGDADGADGAFVFKFGEAVAEAFVLVGPLAIEHAMEEGDIEAFDSEFFTEAVDFLDGVGGGGDPVFFTGPDFAEVDEFIAGQALERLADEGVGAVEVGHIEEGDALVEGVAEEAIEGLLAHAGVVGGAGSSMDTGALGEEGGGDAGFSDGDFVTGGAGCEGGCGDGGGKAGACGDADGGGGEGGLDELASGLFEHRHGWVGRWVYVPHLGN